MAITMSVYFDFAGADTAPGTEQDVDALGPPRIRFKLADNANVDENAKMVVPAAGDGPYYSCWKHLYLYCDDPDGKSISNIRIYSDGSNSMGTGVDWKIGLQFPTKTNASSAGYEVTDAAVGNTVTELVAGHGGITSSATIFNYTVAAPLTVSIGEAGNVINAAGETSNYTLHQVSVANTASAGLSASETISFAYDYA